MTPLSEPRLSELVVGATNIYFVPNVCKYKKNSEAPSACNVRNIQP
jgi:hypothetical protein